MPVHSIRGLDNGLPCQRQNTCGLVAGPVDKLASQMLMETVSARQVPHPCRPLETRCPTSMSWHQSSCCQQQRSSFYRQPYVQDKAEYGHCIRMHTMTLVYPLWASSKAGAWDVRREWSRSLPFEILALREVSLTSEILCSYTWFSCLGLGRHAGDS